MKILASVLKSSEAKGGALSWLGKRHDRAKEVQQRLKIGHP